MSLSGQIFSSDEDSDNEQQQQQPNGISQKDGEGKNEPPKEELIRAKRPRHNKPFNEDLLISAEGLSRIYDEFPLACKFHEGGSETAFLQRMITFYKEWAFQLHPALSFEDVVMKCETLGSKARIRGYLQTMREKERERYMEEVLLPRARERSANEEIENLEIAKLKQSEKKKDKKKKRKHHSNDELGEEHLQQNTTTNDDPFEEEGESVVEQATLEDKNMDVSAEMFTEVTHEVEEEEAETEAALFDDDSVEKRELSQDLSGLKANEEIDVSPEESTQRQS